jgi:expansin
MSPRVSEALAAGLLAVLAACGDASSTGGDDSDGPGSGGFPPVGPTCENAGTPSEHQGEATYYTFADGSGNCGFPATPDNLMVAAMNHVDYAASAVCGSCAMIAGPNGTVTVRIVDQCPECPEGDIDLSPDAFELIAPIEQGRVPITWDYVACEVEGPIVYHFKDGSNPFWTAVQIRNHRTPIQSVEAADGAGNFVALGRVDYNYFIADAGLGEGPYTFRVTDTLGEVLEDGGIPLMDDGDAPGATQFAGCP